MTQTPAEAAKAYAAEHGFTIRANGRRYDIDYGLAHIANVGGYPAALNAMKTYEPPEMRDARQEVEALIADDPARIGRGLRASVYTVDEAADPEWKHSSDPTPRKEHYVARELSEFDAASQSRIRKAARRIAKQRRKAAGKPPGGPWHVWFDGNEVTTHGYPLRSDAIAVVRWGFNHPDPRIRNNWRTRSVTVEYRAS